MTTISETAGREYLTLPEAANLSRHSVSTLRRAIRRRELSAFQPTGRRILIRSKDLDRWIREKPVAGKAS